MPSANNCCVVDRKVKRVNPKCYLHKENPCFHVIGLYEKMGVSRSYCVISQCVNQSIVLSTVNSYGGVCQVLNKTGWGSHML